MENYRSHLIETNKKREKFWGAQTKHEGKEITRFGDSEGEAVKKVKAALDEILPSKEGEP